MDEGPVSSVFLRPGELYFGGPGGLVETLLGSCVSITMWHPRYRIGGMCHYVVPQPGPGDDGEGGHSAVGAVRQLIRDVGRSGTRPGDYDVKIFGGGVQFDAAPDGRRTEGFDIGRRNVDAGLALLGERGLAVRAMHVLGAGHRKIILDLGTGHVWVRHPKPGRGSRAPRAATPQVA